MNRKQFALAIAAGVFLVGAHPRARADDARITVVTILASSNNQDVHPKLAQIASEVKKHEQTLTGFKLLNSQFKDVTVGQKEKFDLLNDVSADVTVLEKDEANKRIRMAVKPPTIGEISYSICYDKFFPIVTRYVSANERLIIAIMVQPPKDKAKDVGTK
jgi:hypothetical protein